MFVDGEYLVTFDEIETESERRINWLLHSESPIDVEGEREFTAKQGDMRLDVKVVEPDRLEHKMEPMMVRVDVAWRPDGKVDYSEIPSQKGYVLDVWPANKTKSVNFLAAYYPYRVGEDQSTPVMRKISGEGWLGIALTFALRKDRIIFNSAGRPVNADDIAIDGKRCLVRTDANGKLKKFVLDGEYLKVGDRTLARLGKSAILVSDMNRATIKCSEALAGELFAPSRPENVYVNDKECEVIYNGDTNLLNLQLQKGYNKVEIEL